MIKLFTPIFALLLCSSLSFGQTEGQKISITVDAIVNENTPSIQIRWNAPPNAIYYSVFRRVLGDATWENQASYLNSTILEYEDTNVVVGQAYEYKVESILSGADVTRAYGYLYSGIKAPAKHSRGGILLVIDNLFTSSLAPELQQLRRDLIGDGWRVYTEYVSRSESHYNVKSKILNRYASAPNLKTVFLIGHIPVPYSGTMAPDGHFDHYGAWVCDAYYGDMDEASWTDVSANVTVATDTRNHNIPGDGKFDQSLFPTEIELQVGRVDMYNLPIMEQTEEELLRNYFNKLHAFKHGETATQYQSVVEDNFGVYPAGSNAWINFSSLVGKDNIDVQDYFSSIEAESYIWSYGSGGGTYTSAAGVVNSNMFKERYAKSIFTMLFGSYFGDWDSQNNLMRVSLATGDILTNCWAGFPNWYFHHMGLGENIGLGVTISQNNASEVDGYAPRGYYPQWAFMSLLGDPSLRMHYMKPAQNVNVAIDNGDAFVTWSSPSSRNTLEYHLYKSSDGGETYERLTEEPLQGTFYIDECVGSGNLSYMVRVIDIEETMTGTYYNMSQGVFADITVTEEEACPDALPVELFSFKGTKGRNSIMLNWQTLSETGFSHFIVERSENATRWENIAKIKGKGESTELAKYKLEDTAPIFGTNMYRLKMVDFDGQIEYSNIISLSFRPLEVVLFPNPVVDDMQIHLSDVFTREAIEITIFNVAGMEVYRKGVTEMENSIKLNLEFLNEGIYVIKIKSGNEIFADKLWVK